MKKSPRFEIDGEKGYDCVSASKYLGITRRTIYTYIGKFLPEEPYKINSGYVFKQSELDLCRQLLNLDRRDLNVTRSSK